MRVCELVSIYCVDCNQRYTRSKHAVNVELGLRPLRECMLHVAEFGVMNLREYRDGLIERGMSRKTINQWVGWVRGMYRWAVGRGMPLEATWRALSAVEALRRGQRDVPEWKLRREVTVEEAALVKQHAGGVVGQMIAVQWLCGMRPSEVCAMRWSNIRRGERFWYMHPPDHKCAQRELFRSMVLLPEAVEFLPMVGESDYVFLSRRAKPYTYNGYMQAVYRACARAGVERWSPGQLRHSAATTANRLAGIEVAQRLLGHGSPRTTQAYLRLGDRDLDAVAQRLLERGFTFRPVSTDGSEQHRCGREGQ